MPTYPLQVQAQQGLFYFFHPQHAPYHILP